MMKETSQAGTAGSALASPAVIVVVVIMLGATIYLWRAGYMRPRTGYVLTILLTAGLIALGAYMYLHPT